MLWRPRLDRLLLEPEGSFFSSLLGVGVCMLDEVLSELELLDPEESGLEPKRACFSLFTGFAGALCGSGSTRLLPRT